MTSLTVAFLTLLLLVADPTPSRATPVTASLVCAVQAAIRWRDAAWSDDRCEAVAGALASTREPLTTLAIAINESDLRAGVFAEARPGVVDVGLMGVRCVTSSTGRCLNGPARGYTFAELMDPATNIRVGAAIMEQKRRDHGAGWLRAYNGGVVAGKGYAAHIAALEAALSGVVVQVRGKRMRELVAKIAQSVRIMAGDPA